MKVRTNSTTDLDLRHFYDESFLSLDEGELVDHTDISIFIKPKREANPSSAFYEIVSASKLVKQDTLHRLFVKMNYLMWKASVLRRLGNDSEAVLSVYEQAMDVREVIVSCSIRAVIMLLYRHVERCMFYRIVDDVLSDVLVKIHTIVRLFDFRCGYKYSTYLFRSVRRHIQFSQTRIKKVLEHEYQNPMSERDEAVSYEREPYEYAIENECPNAVNRDLEESIKSLSTREQIIVGSVFGLDGYEKRSYRNIAKSLGISGERVRQILDRALVRLKSKMLAKHSQEDILAAA